MGLTTVLLHKCDIPLRVKGVTELCVAIAFLYSVSACSQVVIVLLSRPRACSCPLFAYPWEGFIRHRPPGPHPRIRLALPPQGSIWHRNRVKSGNRCRINANRPLRVRGEADSRVPCQLAPKKGCLSSNITRLSCILRTEQNKG